VHTFPCRERHQNSLERRRKLAHERHFSPKVNGKTSLSIGNLFISVEDHPGSEKQNREARVFHVKHSFPSKEKFRALTRAHPQSFSHPSLDLTLQQSAPPSLCFYTPQRKKLLTHLHTQNNRSTMRDISNQHNHDVDNYKHVVIAFTYNRSTLLCMEKGSCKGVTLSTRLSVRNGSPSYFSRQTTTRPDTSLPSVSYRTALKKALLSLQTHERPERHSAPCLSFKEIRHRFFSPTRLCYATLCRMCSLKKMWRDGTASLRCTAHRPPLQRRTVRCPSELYGGTLFPGK